MEYIEGFKYQLHKEERRKSPIVGYQIRDTFYTLLIDGTFIARVGFAWDGCSGSIDTDTNMIPGLFHDIGCLMVAKGQLPPEEMDAVNAMFDTLLHEAGMWGPRRRWHVKAVELHFAGNTKPSRRDVIYLESPVMIKTDRPKTEYRK